MEPSDLRFHKEHEWIRVEGREGTIGISNFAQDAEDRKSVSGCFHTIGGMITNWSSRKQKTTMLSSTEAEYIALAECC